MEAYENETSTGWGDNLKHPRATSLFTSIDQLPFSTGLLTVLARMLSVAPDQFST
jgi:hypothetical protein